MIDPSRPVTLKNLIRSLVNGVLGFFTPIVWMILGSILIVLILRSLCLLQGLELQTTDHYFQLRSAEAIDDRIVIIEVTKADLQRNEPWPPSDARLAQLIVRLNAWEPRAIGINLHRDLPVPPGSAAFNSLLTETSTIISAEQLADGMFGSGIESHALIPPPAAAPEDQVGFNNNILDDDQKVRRAFLYWKNEGGTVKESFALKLSKLYLAQSKIYAQPSSDRPSDLQLGKGVFRQVQPDTGAYVRADAGAYQILVNFRGGKTGNPPFRTFSMQMVLSGDVTPESVRDRIVLIGATAENLNDFAATPYTRQQPYQSKNSISGSSTGSLYGGSTWISGVALQAQFVSQIISAALDGRLMFQSWPEGVEIAWIGLWVWLGVLLCWRLRGPKRSLLGMIGLAIGVTLSGYGLFLLGWLVPVVAPMVGLALAWALVMMVRAHTEEELARSMEFLNRIINTIPDPIFVKDNQNRWVVLNEAYARFVGASLQELIGKTVHDVFPKPEADLFLTRDEETFLQQREREDEEVLTDLFGEVHYISTKRSLHRDSGGNVFLVGVIRDITQRKTREDATEQARRELADSNEELRKSQARLHYLANHDSLTGLPNRSFFETQLQEAIDWSDQSDRMIALFFIDLDGFKQVNDTFGHGVGDRLLQSVAKRLVSCLRASDTVARLGGDEFTVILPGALRLPEIERVATKVIETLTQPFTFDGQTMTISGSIGISLYPHPCQTLTELVETADAAMYEAKQAGKNQYVVWRIEN